MERWIHDKRRKPTPEKVSQHCILDLMEGSESLHFVSIEPKRKEHMWVSQFLARLFQDFFPKFFSMFLFWDFTVHPYYARSFSSPRYSHRFIQFFPSSLNPYKIFYLCECYIRSFPLFFQEFFPAHSNSFSKCICKFYSMSSFQQFHSTHPNLFLIVQANCQHSFFSSLGVFFVHLHSFFLRHSFGNLRTLPNVHAQW